MSLPSFSEQRNEAKHCPFLRSTLSCLRRHGCDRKRPCPGYHRIDCCEMGQQLNLVEDKLIETNRRDCSMRYTVWFMAFTSVGWSNPWVTWRHQQRHFSHRKQSAAATRHEPSRAKSAALTGLNGTLQTSRRMFLRTMLVVSAGFVFPELGPIDARLPSAQAFVDFDVNRYGDKEIRVSTLNRLKQNLRNVLSRSPHLLEPFVRLALADALTYDASTQTGGSNASIRLVLAKRNESAAGGLGTEGGVSRLVEALKALEPIRSFIREVSWADTIAYAGVVALELTRGPRMRVQNGREDAPLQRQEQVWRRRATTYSILIGF
ncbi:hypothetical protein F1559_000801 [Cyanidiococcus yangmingshanensis]|uniref:Plant heme peroxidase family profile domain-containing protein n=1 Tax=Cyanidiococcus yangmingshanensis TaxID=2690220 RepID=A0A7J7IFJ8_9RHOD|nr:hypothetical protein F1559_000801 [Cyanidiococcus yangmingshanensis]